MSRQPASRPRPVVARLPGVAQGWLLRADGPNAPGVGRYVLLWLALLAFSVVVAIDDKIPIAAPNPSLAVAMATLAGIVGLALLYLGVLRFRFFGRPLDLFVGVGFGTLALANIVVRVVIPTVWAGPASEDLGLGMLLFLRAIAAGLFLFPLLRPRTIVTPAERDRYAIWTGAMVGVLLALGVVGTTAAQERFPAAVGPSARTLLDERALIIDALPDQAPWLLVVNGAIALLMLLAAIGYSAWAERGGDPYLGTLVTPFILLTFGQVHALLFPPLAPDYISVAQGLRILAYVVLLLALAGQVGRDLGARAADEERRRLSRELHDGLMQQLSLLNLRLARASALGRDNTARDRDLAAASRVLEAALIEARQAIVALRVGTITWVDFTHTLNSFADEFSANHEVAVEVCMDEAGPHLDAGLQAEILRILHEACSNAIRHGLANSIAVTVAAEGRWLTVCIQDDGRGFQMNRVRQGVGLHSLEERAVRRGGHLWIESAPGAGTTLRAHLPLESYRKATS